MVVTPCRRGLKSRHCAIGGGERHHARNAPFHTPPDGSIFTALLQSLLDAAPASGRLRPKGGGMARRYETVYIFDPALEEPAIGEKLERSEERRVGKGGSRRG